MRAHDTSQAELLERYWSALEADGAAPVPDGLDPEIAVAVRRLHEHAAPPVVDAGFAGRLQRLVMNEAARRSAERTAVAPAASGPVVPLRRPRVRRTLRRPALGLVAAVALAIIAGLFTRATRPDAVSAAEALRRAQSTNQFPAEANIRSVVMTTRASVRFDKGGPPPIGTLRGDTPIAVPLDAAGFESEMRQWYEVPGRTRTEATITDSTGAQRLLSVANGEDLWTYASRDNVARRLPVPPVIGVGLLVAPIGTGATNLNDMLQQAGACFTPRLIEGATVAGRAAYAIELGAPRCMLSGIAPAGKMTIWVDRQTFLVLKLVEYSPRDGQPVATTEVVELHYNVPIDPSLFVFVPPAGATVRTDSPPRPGATPPFAPQPGSPATPLPPPSGDTLLPLLPPPPAGTTIPLPAPAGGALAPPAARP